jgi:DNA-damage-inducible protein D
MDLIVFEGSDIRRVWHEGEWWFSIVDIIAALTGTDRARKYWSDLKKTLSDEGFELSENIGRLKLRASDGKMRLTDCANTQNALRIIQSVPSRRAEPLKRWLAQVGYERIQEIEDPELAQSRMRELYRAKGYSDEWIEKRVRGIAVRDELTGEWEKRGLAQKRDFAILTAQISKATFGMTPIEYKRYKNLSHDLKRYKRVHVNRSFVIIFEGGDDEVTFIDYAHQMWCMIAGRISL